MSSVSLPLPVGASRQKVEKYRKDAFGIRWGSFTWSKRAEKSDDGTQIVCQIDDQRKTHRVSVIGELGGGVPFSSKLLRMYMYSVADPSFKVVLQGLNERLSIQPKRSHKFTCSVSAIVRKEEISAFVIKVATKTQNTSIARGFFRFPFDNSTQAGDVFRRNGSAWQSITDAPKDFGLKFAAGGSQSRVAVEFSPLPRHNEATVSCHVMVSICPKSSFHPYKQVSRKI